VLAEHGYEGPDLMALIDEATIQLRKDLGLPAAYVEETLDLPARDHATASLEALRAYGYADLALLERDDYEAARTALQRVVQLDPTYAAAAFGLYQLSILSGDVDTAMTAIRAAMDHLYRMPERFQFAVRAEWYAAQQQVPKAFAVYKMWAELYPQDLEAQLYSAQVRSFEGDQEGALASLESALAIDPTRLDIVQEIGDLNENLGRPEAARAAYERIIAGRPGTAQGFILLAALESRLGNHEAARELYERASLVESGNVELMTRVGELHADIGEFETAELSYERALEAARTPEQRYAVLRDLRRYRTYRGDYDRALDYQLESESVGSAFQSPLAQIQVRLLGLRTYVYAGRTEEALERLADLTGQMQPPLDTLAPIGRIAVYEAIEDADSLAVALEEARAMLERTGMNMLEQPVFHGRGRLHEIRGEWNAAIAAYQEELRLSPTDTEVPAQLGRVFRAKGDLDAAERYLRQTLTAQPSHGRANYELALVLEERGLPLEAIRYLEQAVATWAPADESYPYAQLARDMLSRLRQGT
jgi:tetratricopeptide (TPR) repeat protein